MIVDFKKEKARRQANKPRNLKAEAIELDTRSKDLDYSSIASMLCGQALSDEDQANIEEFNAQHDEMEDLNSWH